MQKHQETSVMPHNFFTSKHTSAATNNNMMAKQNEKGIFTLPPDPEDHRLVGPTLEDHHPPCPFFDPKWGDWSTLEELITDQPKDHPWGIPTLPKNWPIPFSNLTLDQKEFDPTWGDYKTLQESNADQPANHPWGMPALPKNWPTTTPAT
jgi:hypothetical protein